MNTDLPNREELRELAEAVIEGRLDEEQRVQLEQLVLTNPAALRFYTEYVHQHAALQWSAVDPPSWSVKTEAAFVPEPAGNEVPQARRWSGRRILYVTLAASVAAAAVWLGVGLFGDPKPGPVATLVEAKVCKWDAGTLPTEVGARLSPGRLRLAEGLTRLVFTSGAEITLEGPADLELVSPMKCVLHAGQLVGKVPPQASGFVVETPTSVLTDIGTEFGVRVRGGETVDVQVFDGQVDVLHRSTGRMEAMKTGTILRFTPNEVQPFNPNTDVPADRANTPRTREGARVVQVSTALGRGRDAFVQPIEPPPERRSDTLLLIKHTVPQQPDWNRKAYLGLDLSGVEPRRLLEAELSLTFAPTGMGFASQVPDATFAVYGLMDEALDDWDERAIRWQNAPANRPGGTALDADKVVRLGSFEIAQGQQAGTRTIGGKALVEFLRQDTNRLVTFIVVRETQGNVGSDLVHGFASKRHPRLSPPTLRLTEANPR